MTITEYTDIISLDRTKNYLRTEDTELPELENQEIVSMIKAAFLFMERYTNHIFKPKTFSQLVPPKVYNYPVNSVTDVPDEDWTNYYQRNMDYYCQEQRFTRSKLITYNAGYTETEQIPDDFIQAALQIIKVWYYEAQSQVNETLIPVSVRQVLDTYRRFV